MKTNDELFQLVKSLNKNEKGYFRKFSGIHSPKGEGNYLKLFDCICKMKEYDEAAIRQAFKGEKILKQLPVTKHYLKNLIIRALRNYNEDRMPYIRDAMALADTHIMLSKGLYQGAGKRILKEKQAAIQGDKFLSALQWTTLHDRLLGASFSITELSETGEQLLAEKQKITEKYLNYHGYLYLRSIVVPMNAKRTGSGELQKLEYLINHPLLSSNKMPQSNLARIMYTEVLVRIYKLKNEREKGMRLLREQIAYFEDPKNHHPRNLVHLLVDLNMLFNFMSRAETGEMAEAIDKCRKIVSDTTNSLSFADRNEFQSLIYGHEMRLHLFQRKPELALHSAQKLEQFYKKATPGPDELTWLWVLKAIAFVALKEYDKALVELNVILNHEITEQNYVVFDAYILNIIVHFELGNHSILKRQFTIARNFVKKNHSDKQNELWMLTGLEQLAKLAQRGNNGELKASSLTFLKALRLKKLPEKEYLEDWLEGRL